MSSTTVSTPSSTDVRAWARQHRPDLGVKTTGRLRQSVYDAYAAAQAKSA